MPPAPQAASGIGAAGDPPPSRTYAVPPGTPLLLLSAARGGGAAQRVELVTPDGTTLTDGQLAAGVGGVAFVPELSDAGQKVIGILNPPPGTYTVTLPDAAEGLVEFDAYGVRPSPELALAAPARVEGTPATVRVPYAVTGAGDGASVSLFYDGDGEGFDGVLIAGDLPAAAASFD